MQIHQDAELLGQYTGLTLGLAFGGIDYEKQRQHLEEGVDVLIGTPGRIIDYFKQRVFDLRHVQVLILDEADRMFDLGFIADIRYMMRRLPPPDQRLSMLFSATLSQRVLELAYEHMNEPELVRIEPDKVTADRVQPGASTSPRWRRRPACWSACCASINSGRTMVFVNMKRTAERLESTLRANGINAEAMSGDVPQNKRMRMLRDFHEGELAVLIATDVAARGLHIPDVTPRLQLRPAAGSGGLRAPDRPHRARRRRRRCDQLRLRGLRRSLPDIEAYIGRKLPVAQVEPELVAEVVQRRIHGPPARRVATAVGGRRGAATAARRPDPQAASRPPPRRARHPWRRCRSAGRAAAGRGRRSHARSEPAPAAPRTARRASSRQPRRVRRDPPPRRPPSGRWRQAQAAPAPARRTWRCQPQRPIHRSRSTDVAGGQSAATGTARTAVCRCAGSRSAR